MRAVKYGDKLYRFDIKINPIYPDEIIIKYGDWIFGMQTATQTEMIHALRYIDYHHELLPHKTYKLEDDELALYLERTK